MSEKPDKRELSEIRRRRVAEVEASGVRPLTDDEFDALSERIMRSAGHAEMLAEENAWFTEYQKKLHQNGELRHRGDRSRGARPRGS